MNENNNNGPQNPTGTPNGQENRNNNTPIGDNVQKNNNPNAPKNDNDNDGKTGARKEHDDREHQHDYKTPKAEQTDQEINDIDTENKNPGVNKNEESGPDSKTKYKGV